MLLLCLTGLPLIFHHKIGYLLGTEVEAPEMLASAARSSLDRVLAVAKERHPGKEGMFISREPDDDRVWYVTLSDTPTADTDLKQVAVDARTAAPLAEPKLDEGFIHVMFKLHVDLFAGMPGTLSLVSWACCCSLPSCRARSFTHRSCASWHSAPCGMTVRPGPNGWTCITCFAS